MGAAAGCSTWPRSLGRHFPPGAGHCGPHAQGEAAETSELKAKGHEAQGLFPGLALCVRACGGGRAQLHYWAGPGILGGGLLRPQSSLRPVPGSVALPWPPPAGCCSLCVPPTSLSLQLLSPQPLQRKPTPLSLRAWLLQLPVQLLPKPLHSPCSPRHVVPARKLDPKGPICQHPLVSSPSEEALPLLEDSTPPSISLRWICPWTVICKHNTCSDSIQAS